MRDIFNRRNRSYSYVNRISDYLGKSIRENTTILNFDDVNKRVSILTESEHVIEADVNFNENRVSLNKIKVFSKEDYFSDEKFEEDLSDSTLSLVSHLNQKEFSKSENQLAQIIEKFDRKANNKKAKALLERKSRSVSNRSILDTETWQKLQEGNKNFIKFLKENKEDVLDNTDLLNTVVLSRALASAIQVPQITLEELSKRKRFSIPLDYTDSIYDMICQKELVQKELLEAKNDFASMYTSRKSMHKLAIGWNANDEHLNELLFEAIQDVPMLALTTKQQLAEAVGRVYSLFQASVSVSEAKLTEFISRLYEAKKPYKEAITDTLNKDYGINVTSLTYRPSFESLAKANSASLEILSKITKQEYPSLSESLLEASKELRHKAGFSTLYISDFLNTAFTKSGILEGLDMASGPQEVDLEAIKQHLMAIKSALLGEPSPEEEMGMEGEPGMEDEMGDPGLEGGPEMGEEEPVEVDTGEGDDDIHVDIDSHNGEEEEMSPEEEYNEGEAEPEPDGDEIAAMGGEPEEDLEGEMYSEEEPGMEEEMPEEGGVPEMPEEGDEMQELDPMAGEDEQIKSELMDILQDVEALIGLDKQKQQRPVTAKPDDIRNDDI